VTAIPNDASNSHDAPDLEALEAAVGYRFRDRSRLLTAVTHRSFAHEVLLGPCPDNEPLEFLGDAVLGFLVATRLFREFPGLDEGRLSKHASVLEKASTLGAAGRELCLGRFIRLGRGERREGGTDNEKILSDAYEAVLAAIFLDGGLEAAEAFVDRTLGPRIGALDAARPVTDYKSTLQEETQARGLGLPQYRVLAEHGPDHDRQFHVCVSIDGRDVAEGRGTTKRGAQQVAARLALERLRAEACSGPRD
jgi:ribonuclease-3